MTTAKLELIAAILLTATSVACLFVLWMDEPRWIADALVWLSFGIALPLMVWNLRRRLKDM